MTKKLMIAILLSCIMMVTPVMAKGITKAELLAKIEALEQRVAQLEAQLGVSALDELSVEASQYVTLTMGGWIAGEDFPAGKYDLAPTSGHGDVQVYGSFDEYQAGRYRKQEFSLISQELLDDTSLSNHDYYVQFYSPKASNIQLAEGVYVYIDSTMSLALIPVQ